MNHENTVGSLISSPHRNVQNGYEQLSATEYVDPPPETERYVWEVEPGSDNKPPGFGEEDLELIDVVFGLLAMYFVVKRVRKRVPDFSTWVIDNFGG